MREAFRKRRSALAGLDVIVRLRTGAVPGLPLDRELGVILDKVVQ